MINGVIKIIMKINQIILTITVREENIISLSTGHFDVLSIKV